MRMVTTGFAALVLFTLATTARAEEPKKGAGRTDPAGVPLELRLTAKKTEYKLDLGGKSGKEFRKHIEEAKKAGTDLPAPPAISLRLELRNTGDKDIPVKIGGDETMFELHLKGPGALTVDPMKAFTQELRLGRPMTLAPGKSVTFEIEALKFGFRGEALHAYWTEPGEYTLTASYRVPVSPAPKGAKEAEEGYGLVTVTSSPVKVEVKK